MVKKIPTMGRHVEVAWKNANDLNHSGHFVGIITQGTDEVDGVIPAIQVFPPGVQWTLWNVPYDETGETHNSWSWPKYVPDVEVDDGAVGRQDTEGP